MGIAVGEDDKDRWGDLVITASELVAVAVGAADGRESGETQAELYLLETVVGCDGVKGVSKAVQLMTFRGVQWRDEEFEGGRWKGKIMDEYPDHKVIVLVIAKCGHQGF